MFKIKKNKPDADDMLVAIRRDGNVIIDRNIHQTLGMIISDEYTMAVRNDELVSFVEWVRADAPPVGKGNSFFLRDEPGHPTEDSYIMYRVLPAMYNRSSLGRSAFQVAARKRRMILTTIFGVCIALSFLVVFGVVPVFKPPSLVTLPEETIEAIIAEQDQTQRDRIDAQIRKLEEQQREFQGLTPVTTPEPAQSAGQ